MKQIGADLVTKVVPLFFYQNYARTFHALNPPAGTKKKDWNLILELNFG